MCDYYLWTEGEKLERGGEREVVGERGERDAGNADEYKKGNVCVCMWLRERERERERERGDGGRGE